MLRPSRQLLERTHRPPLFDSVQLFYLTPTHRGPWAYPPPNPTGFGLKLPQSCFESSINCAPTTPTFSIRKSCFSSVESVSQKCRCSNDIFRCLSIRRIRGNWTTHFPWSGRWHTKCIHGQSANQRCWSKTRYVYPICSLNSSSDILIRIRCDSRACSTSCWRQQTTFKGCRNTPKT